MDARPSSNRRSQRILPLSRGVILSRHSGICKTQNYRSDAPAVAFGVLQRALHFDVENFHKPIGSNGFGAWSGKVRRAMTTRKYPHDGLLDPVGFKTQSKRV